MPLKTNLLARVVGWRRPAAPEPRAPEAKTPGPKASEAETPTAKNGWDKALDELADPVEDPDSEEETPLLDPAKLGRVVI